MRQHTVDRGNVGERRTSSKNRFATLGFCVVFVSDKPGMVTTKWPDLHREGDTRFCCSRVGALGLEQGTPRSYRANKRALQGRLSFQVMVLDGVWCTLSGVLEPFELSDLCHSGSRCGETCSRTAAKQRDFRKKTVV